MADYDQEIAAVIERVRVESYDRGKNEGRVESGFHEVPRVMLDLQADALESASMRLQRYPNAVSALNEATAILRDAAKAVADPPTRSLDGGDAVAREVVTAPDSSQSATRAAGAPEPEPPPAPDAEPSPVKQAPASRRSSQDPRPSTTRAKAKRG